MSDRKNILLIATGGTIASKKSDNGLKPQISPEELMQYIPQVKDICDFHAVQLINLDSSNMEPKHWKMMVHTIRENYEKYDGFVIAHGTDTMAYTAAALSYMIQNSKKPIVITGAQKPIDLEITDAKSNQIGDHLHRGRTDRAGGLLVTVFYMHPMRTRRGFRSFLTEKSLRERERKKSGPKATMHFPALIFHVLP